MQIPSVYIHIPFCQQICHYCDFTKFFYNEKLADDYLNALEQEMQHYVLQEKITPETIFVGGGTPTALSKAQLKKLLLIIERYHDIESCKEYTFEANPGDLDEEKVNLLKAFGVNRISLGVQVFDDDMLEKIGRLHKVKDVYTNIERLLGAGITNISIDLIYALPGQTESQFERTVDEALKFDLPHYSSYSLQIEPKTVFYQRYKKGKLIKPPEESEARMYELLQDKMTVHGKHQYEISNFAEPGYESRHNLTYWNNEFYYGFGAGAHGYLPGRRIVNLRPLPAYIKQASENGRPVLHEEPIGIKERMEEEMFLGLRKTEGVDIHRFELKFGKTIEQIFGDAIPKLEDRNLIVRNPDKIALTEKGRILGNEVFQEFLLEGEES
ncbi:radical SAM family heme chaperone HemW [Thalassobacillus devorans]|uniref:radical SAM family heme chaperone HemW n=1 Tax=Thalassobacillus devorans TaxID=279813 RepID=UPI00048F4201|nr:radical SAM family heme chaperone HemW [Thalassobacillus devorans]